LVSWGRSFKASLLLLAFTILWAIVGGVIMIAGMSLIPPTGVFYTDPWTGLPVINWGMMIGAIILWIIGYLIILLGVSASFFKVNTEIIVEELRKQTPPPPPT
jgi:uncharacterized membrane protein